LLIVVTGVGAAIALLTVAFNVVLANRLDSDAADVLRAQASAQLQTLSTVDGRLTVTEAPDQATRDTMVWLFSGPRLLEGPARVAPQVRAAVASLIGGPRAQRDVGQTDTRLLAVPVVAGGRRLGTVVEALSLAPYEQTEHVALIASLGLAAVLLLAVALAARWTIAAALRPVARMTHAADEWSEREPDRRFGLGPVADEITHLGATLDRLMDRLAASLAHERRFSAEISHELRTPLARLLAEAQLALRGERESSVYRAALERIVESGQQIHRTLEALLAAARAESSDERGSADAGAVARAVGEAAAELAGREGVKVDVDVDPATGGARLAAAADLVERILAPLVENACRYGRSSVTLTVALDPGARVRYEVIDDGPGVHAGERERIFEPAVRGSAAAANGQMGVPGAGLGLALARRLARAAGGDVEAEVGGTGGRFVVWLPQAGATPTPPASSRRR
jgi:signal transduction histidine kinase